ncbi:hypothetical protein LINPERPRIM_LOCUS14601 [Linum perenne]
MVGTYALTLLIPHIEEFFIGLATICLGAPKLVW